LKLAKLSNLIDAELFGSSDFDIQTLSEISNSSNSSIIFVNNEKLIDLVDKENVGAILTSKILSKHFSDCNILVSSNPKLSFAKLTYIFKKNRFNNKVNTSVEVQKFIIGKNSSLGLNVVIEDNVIIGKNVTIGHNVVIHDSTIIGDNVTIDSGSIIGSEGFGNVRDKDSKWLHIAHLGGVHIQDNVSIGANCTIDRGTIGDTIIEKGVVMDNQIHIAHNVIIGENSAIAGKAAIAGSSRIGKRNLIGGMVGIIDHISTADDVIISATSTVHKDINESGVYTGIFPISKHSLWKRIALWITKLDKIAKLVNFKK